VAGEQKAKTIGLVTESEGMLVSTGEAARLLGVKGQTLRLWRSQSRGPAFIVMGSRRLYHLDDLSAWLGAHRVRNTEQARQLERAEKEAAR